MVIFLFERYQRDGQPCGYAPRCATSFGSLLACGDRLADRLRSRRRLPSQVRPGRSDNDQRDHTPEPAPQPPELQEVGATEEVEEVFPRDIDRYMHQDRQQQTAVRAVVHPGGHNGEAQYADGPWQAVL